MKTVKIDDLAKMKSTIKNMVEQQKSFKNQRRTVNLVGERTINPNDATYKHTTNRDDLRIMYAAYGVARGRKYSQIENCYSEERHPLRVFEITIDRILKKYRTLSVEVIEEVAVAV